MVEKAEAIMIRQSADIFQYAGKMVRPVVQEQALSGGKRGNIAQFKEITHSYLLTELARYIDWRKFDKGKNEFVPARPEDRSRERDAFTGGEVEFQKGVRRDYGPDAEARRHSFARRGI